MPEAFPCNPSIPAPRLTLLGQYHFVLRGIGLQPDSTLPHLFYTFCGDILGSSGAHYEKGSPKSFDFYRQIANLHPSDDFMESLAMTQMANEVIDVNLTAMRDKKDRFFTLIGEHFLKLSETYSPWAGELFRSATDSAYATVLATHSSCGAAMRAPTLAALGLPLDNALMLMLITHAQLQAVEGGAFIYAFGEAARRGGDFAACLSYAKDVSAAARLRTQTIQRDIGIPPQDFAPIDDYVTRVLTRDDPYAAISDITEEGIETYFVVPAVLHALAPVFDQVPEPHQAPIGDIITRAMTTGGDPDTICSIALGLYGLRWPRPAHQTLAALTIGPA